MSSHHTEGKNIFTRGMGQDHQVVLKALLVTINLKPGRPVRPPSVLRHPVVCTEKEIVHPSGIRLLPQR